MQIGASKGTSKAKKYRVKFSTATTKETYWCESWTVTGYNVRIPREKLRAEKVIENPEVTAENVGKEHSYVRMSVWEWKF